MWKGTAMRTFPVTTKSVSCKAGESFAIEATGSGATGYVWFVEISNPNHNVELKSRSVKTEQATGSMGSERFEFVCRRSGHADVLFDLRRPWASGAAKSFKLKVDVK